MAQAEAGPTEQDRVAYGVHTRHDPPGSVGERRAQERSGHPTVQPRARQKQPHVEDQEQQLAQTDPTRSVRRRRPGRVRKLAHQPGKETLDAQRVGNPTVANPARDRRGWHQLDF